MPIPASYIVAVNPRVISGGSDTLETNGLFFTKNPLLPSGSIARSFPSAASVGAFFGLQSAEYVAATHYFNGYKNRSVSPNALFFARRIDADIPASLRGAAITASVADLKKITDGSLVLTVNGSETTAADIDLSAITAFSDVAAAIQAKISGVAVSYDSLSGGFTVTTTQSGASASIGFASRASEGTDLSGLLCLTESSGAVVSAGADAMTVAENMAAVLAVTQNFVTFSTLWEAEDYEEYAAWASANYGCVYVGYTTVPATLEPSASNDPASVVKAGAYDNTAMIYGDVYLAAFVMGTAASIAWTRPGGTITFAFKSQAGLAATVMHEEQAAALDAKNCSYYGQFATRNAEFNVFYPGVLSASEYGYLDPLINSIWFNNRLQVALLDGLIATGRLPYTDAGYTRLRSWMMDPVNEALSNGIIEPGVTLSEAQKSEVAKEAGLDISEELYTSGYYIQILDPGASVRARRESPIISLWYTYGGAVQKIEVASTAIL